MKIEFTPEERRLLLVLLGLLLAGSLIYYFRHNSLWTNAPESFKNNASSTMEIGFAPPRALTPHVSHPSHPLAARSTS
jgi:hypothetical protein